MKLKITTIVLLLLLVPLDSMSQISIPTNVLPAYDNNTRQYDGKPGKNYWQNYSDYNIKVSVDVAQKVIKGKSSITYHNESPDSLNMIVIRLYPNLYKKGALRNFPINAKDITDGVLLRKVMLNGILFSEDSKGKFNLQGTTLLLHPDEKIKPKSETTLEFEWEYNLPQISTIRTGAYDSTSFFVAYWYPQIAVYDDIYGWDVLPYNGEQEYYNDFNNYNVDITVPSNIGVWATGELQNAKDVLTPEHYNRFETANNSDTIIHIIKESDYEKGNPFLNKSEFNTWEFKAKGVTDFAFATSNHYLWDGAVSYSGTKENPKVFVSAVYNRKSEDFYEVAEIAKASIEFFAQKSPAYPFPFPCLTVYNGRGGMEFPMMVNDGSTSSRASTVGLTSHEIAHSYFPFMMGTNEKLHAWMDESWAVMLPFEYQESEGGNPLVQNINSYLKIAGSEFDVPPIVPSYQLRGNSYRLASYTRPALSFHFLRDMLGDSLFFKALHEFMSDWKGKHPTPYDFFLTFNNVVKEDLSWFWNPWFYEYGYPDLSIKYVNISDNIAEVVIERIGNIPIPISLSLEMEDGNKVDYYYSAYDWKNRNRQIALQYVLKSKIKKITLGNERIPDLNLDNNFFIERN